MDFLLGLKVVVWKLGLAWRDEASYNLRPKAVTVFNPLSGSPPCRHTSSLATGKPYHPWTQSYLSVAWFPSTDFSTDSSDCRNAWRTGGKRLYRDLWSGWHVIKDLNGRSWGWNKNHINPIITANVQVCPCPQRTFLPMSSPLELLKVQNYCHLLLLMGTVSGK